MAYLGDNGLSKLWVRMKSYINNRIETLEQGVVMDLLWTNASPSSNFAAQTISLDLSEYEAVLITAHYTAGYTNDVSVIVTRNNGGILNAGINVNMYRTVYKMTDAGISFEAGYVCSTYKTPTIDHSRMIPYEIYGIKGVQ